MFCDRILLCLSYGFMFFYTMFMLGRPNFVEQRCFLSMAGVSAIGMGIAISIGLTMVFGFLWTNLHGILPFLALGNKNIILLSSILMHCISGIGIDDMFVIVQCLDNLTEQQVSSLTIPERIAVTMKHAGVAITVT
jgi:Niemann-Pick C1 protein